MAFTGFTDDDYDVFDIPLFADRMAAIRGRIRPQLLEIGQELLERLSGEFGPEFYAHVASHMRRRVNPPPDTWVAFGPEKRGYKAYPHLSVGISGEGPYIEFIVMEESAHKTALANSLSSGADEIAQALNGLDGCSLHLDHHTRVGGLSASRVTSTELISMARELTRLKSNEFMIARPFDRDDAKVQGRALLDTAETIFRDLRPFYRMAVDGI